MDIGEAIGEFEINLEGPLPSLDPISWGKRACTSDSLAPDRPLVGWTFWELTRRDAALTPLQFEITRHLKFGIHADDPWFLAEYGKLWMPGVPFNPPCGNRGRPCTKMPEPRCGCGIWAYKDRESVKYCGVDIAGPQSTVFGEVLGWGRIALHERGWRSQFAYPLSFQIYCTDCYVNKGAVVQADVLGVDPTWHWSLVHYGLGFCTTKKESGLSAYLVQKYLRTRYLYARGFSSPFLQLTDERLGQVLDRFGLMDHRANGQEVTTHREFQKVRIFSLIFGREETNPHRVCQSCGMIGQIYKGPMPPGPWSNAWKLLPNFVGRFHDFVCAPCGQLARSVRPHEHKASNPREWVADLLEDQPYRFCGICQKKEAMSEIVRVRGEWLCPTCSSRLEDILWIDEAARKR